MRFLIDGYNVIFAMRAALDESATPFDPNAERDRLLDLLVRYRRRHPAPMHVVFDGGRTGYSSTLTQRVDGIDVSYTAPGETADDLIKDHLRESHGPKSIVLVTGDRDIRRTAQKRRSKMLSGEEFVKLVFDELKRKRRPEVREKYTGLHGQADVDYWMRLFGFDDEDDTGSRS